MQLIDQLCEIKVNSIFTLNRRLIADNKILSIAKEIRGKEMLNVGAIKE
jgi:hypothetical protein